MMLRTYSVYGTVHGSKYLGDYEAENEEGAIQMALHAKGCVCLCHECASECEDAEIVDVVAVVASKPFEGTTW